MGRAAGAAHTVPGQVQKFPDHATRCLLATSDLDVGGMDEMVAFLARRLREYGLHTAVLHTCATTDEEGAKGRIGRELTAAGVDVVKLSEKAGRRWLASWGPDVISAHGAPDWVLDHARLHSVPYVEVLHGMHSLFGVDWSHERRRSRDIDTIIAVSELVRRQYLAGTSFPADRIVTVPNGVDGDRRIRVHRPDARAALGLREEFLFVSLARHCPQKNTFGLVAAFDEVADEHADTHLLIAGRPEDPVYCAQVRRLRDRLPCRDRIHLRDHAADPALLLSAADGFVLDSFFEGWALASMEALHAGIPVVISDVGGAREQLGDDDSRGYLVSNPIGDPLAVNWTSIRSACYEEQINRDELVSAMGALVRDRARWEAGRDRLASESAERFDPQRCAREHAEVLLSRVGTGV